MQSTYGAAGTIGLLVTVETEKSHRPMPALHPSRAVVA